MIEDGTDRALFMDPRDFGAVGVFTPAGGEGVAVAGIFDAAHREAVQAEAGVSTSAPAFTVFATDLPAGAAQGDALEVEGRRWRVADMEPDGTGLVRLVLELNQ